LKDNHCMLLNIGKLGMQEKERPKVLQGYIVKLYPTPNSPCGRRTNKGCTWKSGSKNGMSIWFECLCDYVQWNYFMFFFIIWYLGERQWTCWGKLHSVAFVLSFLEKVLPIRPSNRISPSELLKFNNFSIFII